MAHFLQLGSVTIGTGCTDSSVSASVAVPSRGNVTITASMVIEITHTSGTSDTVAVFGSTSRFGDCSDTAGYAVVPASAASDNYYLSVPVALTSPVATSGTYTYTVAALTSGTAYIYFASGYVVFYPG
jgi:hypothetical protein